MAVAVIGLVDGGHFQADVFGPHRNAGVFRSLRDPPAAGEEIDEAWPGWSHEGIRVPCERGVKGRFWGRAKSDVANKLVSMFPHDVSRKACSAAGMTVSDARFAESVVAAFGNSCLYLGKELTAAVVPVVEHLNGMDRVSVGLHVPGNVAMACKACHNEKRDDDQKLLLAGNGWESFLSHDGTRCATTCKTCAYWRWIRPDDSQRLQALTDARRRVTGFQAPYGQFIRWSTGARGTPRVKIEALYRDCQRFATEEIDGLVA